MASLMLREWDFEAGKNKKKVLKDQISNFVFMSYVYICDFGLICIRGSLEVLNDIKLILND